jgi:D-alanyl-lipoteichoic acid acyltransferase DltB (MBOAT superfamily)
MNFASLQFAGFLILLLAATLALRRHEHRNTLMLVASYYFYACWDPRFLLLIWAVTGASFLAGRRLGATEEPSSRKRILVAYIVFSLVVLGIFKYCDFFIESTRAALTILGLPVDLKMLGILLPAGISFFTFESLSYVIEIYQRHLPATTRLKHYALFIAFFPKLVAGPIERPAVLIPQIQRPRAFTIDAFTRGSFLILLGLFKKIVVADGLAPTVASVFNSSVPQSAPDIVLAVYAFALQIYCDFSGYTDIARGVAKLFGIELSQNFRFPYFSSNPSEFWKRWHISLSSWLRDYLYIPLGGNRLGEARTRVNLMITMLLGGLWHGAAWNFVAWGGYQGALLVGHRVKPRVLPSSMPQRLVVVVSTFLFFQLVCYGWLLFRAHSFAQIASFTGQLLHGDYRIRPTLSVPSLATLIGCLVLVCYDFMAYRSERATFYRSWPIPVRAALYAVMLFVLLMGLANARSAFIYFQF